MKNKIQIEKALEHKREVLLKPEINQNRELKRIVINQIKLLQWVLDR